MRPILALVVALVANYGMVCAGDSSVQQNPFAIQWNSATLLGIRDAKLGAPVVARALAIVHTCMYDA